jgi:hypothetical protein
MTLCEKLKLFLNLLGFYRLMFIMIPRSPLFPGVHDVGATILLEKCTNYFIKGPFIFYQEGLAGGFCGGPPEKIVM